MNFCASPSLRLRIYLHYTKGVKNSLPRGFIAMASPTVFGALIPCQQPTYDPFHLLTVSLFEDQSRPGAFTKHLHTSTHHFPMAHDRLVDGAGLVDPSRRLN